MKPIQHIPSYFIFLILFLFFTSAAQAQVTVNTDSLLVQAQERAKTGHYRESRQLLRQVLAAAPDYTDAALLMGRTYAWEEKFDSARIVLVPLHEKQPANLEIVQALADIELWAGNAEQSLDYTDKGLLLDLNNVPILLVQAKAHQQLQVYPAAISSLNRVLELEPNHAEARKLLEQIRAVNLNNLIRAELQVTAFNESFSSWQLASLEYMRTSPKGKFLGRLSYADRFEKRSAQFEVDAYPKLTPDSYLYLNAGFSDGNLFPGFRAGAEIYHMLPYKFEASVGGRFLAFSGENVFLYTGYIGRYFRKQWVAFRPFLQLTDGDWRTTGILQVRQYFRHTDDYITLILSRGSTPLNQVGLDEIIRLNSSRIGLDSQFRVGKNFLVGGLFSYEYEEYLQDTHRNRFTFGLSAQRKF